MDSHKAVVSGKTPGNPAPETAADIQETLRSCEQAPHNISSRGRKQLLLRLNPDVYEAIAHWASDELRSVNSQIEIILRRALAAAGRDPQAAPMRPRGRPAKN